jgi:predicted ABC-class ATPase
MSTLQILERKLCQLDGQSYRAYKEIAGTYQFPDFTLIIDYVQGDPFAAPSRLRVQVPLAVAAFPEMFYNTPSRAIALRDYLNRRFDRQANLLKSKRGSGKSGLIAIAKPQQQVLERSAIGLGNCIGLDQPDWQVEARFVVGLPARGRTILGRQAAELLCDDLPEIVERALRFASLNAEAIQRHVEQVEDADWLRSQLASHDLVSFIADGAILPRQSGVDDQPLAQAASPFQSPPELRVAFDRPNQGKITGMGIPRGITLIVGGGYHGKSTLLKAIALGIYNHIPGDGREQIVTDPTATKIRAEDGRSIVGVDISPFINRLPQGRSTTEFSTENASGSTSQAANIIEALEMGASVLLVDEDTSATNFMIRDRRMQALIAKDKEPITPFIDKIRQLYDEHAVSTILVMGGSGDYFDVADTVIALTDFVPSEVTDQAKAIAREYATDRQPEGGNGFGKITARMLKAKRLDSPREREAHHSNDYFGERASERPGDRYANRSGNRDRTDSGDRAEREERYGRDRYRRDDRYSQENHDGQSAETSARGFREPRQDRGPKTKVRDVDELVFGNETVDLSAVEQIVDVGQLRAIAAAIIQIQAKSDDQQTLVQLIQTCMAAIATQGFDCLSDHPSGELAQFRAMELAAVINRLRSLEII